MKLRSGNRWYVLLILTLVYALNHVDRQIMVILQEPIKQEFGISDTQLGMLTGVSVCGVLCHARDSVCSLG